MVHDDPLTRALNHPIGHVTQALLNWWYRQGPKAGEGLKDEIKTSFTEMCTKKDEKFRNGRVLLATHVLSLYRVDVEWTRKNLLPLFNWQHSEVEARAAWGGYLWSPRLYRPLIADIKKPFLETASHLEQLGEHADQYISFLTFAALDRGDTFSIEELANIYQNLPKKGLEIAAMALVRAIEGVTEQRGEYWKNRIHPFIHKIWPKYKELRSPELSENLGRLCLEAEEAFPEALNVLKHWLQPVPHPYYLIKKIHEKKLCEKFPENALGFLDAVIGDEAQHSVRGLGECLNKIRKSVPKRVDDKRFIRLNELRGP